MSDADKRRPRKAMEKPPTSPRIVPEVDPATNGPDEESNALESRGGKPGRSGPAKGNTNAIRHGLHANRHGMVGGKLPKGCAYIEKRVNGLRRQVEALILEDRGEIGILDAANVNSILKWERHGLLASHWLRKESEKMSYSDKLKFSEAIAKASDNRDKALRALKLDRDETDDVIIKLYGPGKAG